MSCSRALTWTITLLLGLGRQCSSSAPCKYPSRLRPWGVGDAVGRVLCLLANGRCSGRAAGRPGGGMAAALEDAKFVQYEETLCAGHAVAGDPDGVVRLFGGYGVVAAGVGVFGLVAPPAQPVEGS